MLRKNSRFWLRRVVPAELGSSLYPLERAFGEMGSHSGEPGQEAFWRDKAAGVSRTARRFGRVAANWLLRGGDPKTPLWLKTTGAPVWLTAQSCSLTQVFSRQPGAGAPKAFVAMVQRRFAQVMTAGTWQSGPGLKPACSGCLIQGPEGACSLPLIHPSAQISRVTNPELNHACRRISSCTQFSGFSTYFGRGLKAETEVQNVDNSMNALGVSI